MALTTCKECGKEVSTSAKTCLHCGISNPAFRWKDLIVGLVAVVVIIFLLSQCSSDDAKDAEVTKQIAIDDAVCKLELSCWGEKHDIAAGVYCKSYVEKLANYSFRWTDGTLEPKFSHYRWLNKETSTLTYIGDKIEFQNGFGAYQRHVYECDFDPASNSILDVRANPGHL